MSSQATAKRPRSWVDSMSVEHVIIHHLRDFSRSLYFYTGEGIQPHFPADYEPVAHVECHGYEEPTAALEIAFRKTNSIEHHWTESTGVTLLDDRRHLPRSTSVGDVAVFRGI